MIRWVAGGRRAICLVRRLRFPPGYGTAMVGVVVFWLWGIADLFWHAALAIERGDARRHT